MRLFLTVINSDGTPCTFPSLSLSSTRKSLSISGLVLPEIHRHDKRELRLSLPSGWRDEFWKLTFVNHSRQWRSLLISLSPVSTLPLSPCLNFTWFVHDRPELLGNLRPFYSLLRSFQNDVPTYVSLWCVICPLSCVSWSKPITFTRISYKFTLYRFIIVSVNFSSRYKTLLIFYYPNIFIFNYFKVIFQHPV